MTPIDSFVNGQAAAEALHLPLVTVHYDSELDESERMIPFTMIAVEAGYMCVPGDVNNDFIFDIEADPNAVAQTDVYQLGGSGTVRVNLIGGSNEVIVQDNGGPTHTSAAPHRYAPFVFFEKNDGLPNILHFAAIVDNGSTYSFQHVVPMPGSSDPDRFILTVTNSSATPTGFKLFRTDRSFAADQVTTNLECSVQSSEGEKTVIVNTDDGSVGSGGLSV